MIILRIKTFTYHTEISKVIKRNKGKLDVLDQARLTDALEGVVERSRRRQAKKLRLKNIAKNSTLGSVVGNKEVPVNTSQRQAERLANLNTINSREEELIKKRARRLKL